MDTLVILIIAIFEFGDHEYIRAEWNHWPFSVWITVLEPKRRRGWRNFWPWRIRFAWAGLLSNWYFSKCTLCSSSFRLKELLARPGNLQHYPSGSICHMDCNKWNDPISIFQILVSLLFDYRVIRPDCPDGKEGAPLFTRWFLFRCPAFAIFLHNFHRSDLDEHHDHPWSFVTFLFNSGYWEHTPTVPYDPNDAVSIYRLRTFMPNTDRRTWRRRFSVLYRPAEFQHYIEIPAPCWTLVIRFRERREWGFWSQLTGLWTRWDLMEKSRSRSICQD